MIFMFFKYMSTKTEETGFKQSDSLDISLTVHNELTLY